MIASCVHLILSILIAFFLKVSCIHNTFNITEQPKCTGTYFETGDQAGNGKDRPPPGTPCDGGCIEDSGRWGNSYCNTKDGNWGAECVDCEGKDIHILLSLCVLLLFHLILN